MPVVYSHNKPCGEVFYVGIGKNQKRAYNKINRTKIWKNVVAKHGYEVKIIRDNLNWEEACELEIFIINFYGRRDLGKGTLVNMTDGGDGTLGRVLSKEARKRVGLAQSARKGDNHPLRGVQKSESHLKAFSLSRTGSKINGKKVICVDTLKVWNSIRACEEDTGLRFLKEYLNTRSSIRNITPIVFLKDYKKGILNCKHEPFKNGKEVMDVKTNIIYKSIKEANEKTGVPISPMYKAFKNGDIYKSRNETYVFKVITN